jgi:uncharacterized protein (DUF302 family)
LPDRKEQPVNYGNSMKLTLDFSEAVPKMKEAFAAQGFGTLTEIDVQATLQAKVGAHMEPYIILGACNPQLAHRALEVTRDIGLLLPCNVVIRQDDGGVTVQALDSSLIATLSGDPALQPIANDAARRIDAALDSLADGR